MNTYGTPDQSSPPWEPGTRLMVGAFLFLLVVVLLFLVRQLIAPLLLSLLLAYLLHPVVTRITRRWGISRRWAVLLVYVTFVVIFLATTTGLGVAISQRIIQLGSYLGELSEELPAQIETLADQVITLGPWTFDLAQINLDPLLTELASAVGPLLSETGNLLASAARAMASAVTLVFLVMIIGYYLLVDFDTLDDGILSWAPPAYQADIRLILEEMSRIWNAFLRGQALLGLVIGTVVAVILTLLGVRFALVLGLIAGLMEFVPMFGPLISAVVAVLVALFQGGNSWGLSPFAFGMLVLVVFLVIQQVENNILVPRIIGQSLNLHPLAVLLAVLAGGLIAGVLGLLLAAPLLATARLCFGYAYRKAIGLEGQVHMLYIQSESPIKRRSMLERLRGLFQSRKSETVEGVVDED
jgi:predicted PurR-regulated permease PerM